MRSVKKIVYDYKGKFSIQGKECIVTGGMQGLPGDIAEGLLENGAEVVLVDLQKGKLEQTVEEYCRKGYKTHGIAGDLSKKAELDRMFDEAMELLRGKLDVVIPAAGIQRQYEPWEFSGEMRDLVINVDLDHVQLICQRAIQIMWDKDTVGKIINIDSMNSFFDGTTVPACSAAKGAVTQLSRSITSGCADHSICCNVITPNHMDMEVCTNMSQERKDECTKRIAAGRWGRPEDLKGPILFLASSVSDYLDGAVIPVDGGFLVRSQEADQVSLEVLET